MRRVLGVLLLLLLASLPMLAVTRLTKAQIDAQKAAKRAAAKARRTQQRTLHQQIRSGAKLTRQRKTTATTRPSNAIPVKQFSVRRSAAAGSVTSTIGLKAAASADPTIYDPWIVVTGDFDNDGKVDLLFDGYQGDYSTEGLFFAKGKGDGTFEAAVLTNINFDWNTEFLLAADLNNDKFADLIEVRYDYNVTVWMNNTDGSFAAPVSYTIGSDWWNMGYLLKDLDGDGKLDLAVANGSQFEILTGTGVPATPFTAGTPVTWTSDYVWYPVIADFNGDGYLDVAAETYSDTGLPSYYALEVALGKADGTFNTPTKFDKTVSFGYIYNDSYGMAVADVNGDGKPDVVTADYGGEDPSFVSVWVNQGAGSFASKAPVWAGVDNTDGFFAVTDVDGDGKQDVIVPDYDSGVVSVLRGIGDEGLGPAASYAVGGWPEMQPAVGDFNGDGKPDIAVANYEYDVALLRNQGDGTFFAADHTYPKPTSPVDSYYAYPEGVAFADFNRDGFMDVATGNYWSADSVGATVYLNRGDGTLAPGNNVGSSFYGELPYVAAGDLDGDGIPDLVGSDQENDRVQVFFGVGDGRFTSPVPYDVYWPEQILLVDVNGDGKLDVVLDEEDYVGILLNDGTGNLQPEVQYSLNDYGSHIAAGDVNGDGIIDLVARGEYGVDVLLGKADPKGEFENAFYLWSDYFDDYYTTGIALADVNGDGKLDIVTPTQDFYDSVNDTWVEGVVVALANGDPAALFDAPVLYPTTLRDSYFDWAYPLSVATADVNGDGFADIAVGNYEYGTVSVLFGDGTGAFSNPTEYLTSIYSADLGTADLNNDGAPDVVNVISGYDGEYGSGVTTMLNTGGTKMTMTPSRNSSGATSSVAVSLSSTVKGVTAIPSGSIKVTEGTTDLGTGTLANGSATVTFGSSLAGSSAHSLTVSYLGDSNFRAVSLPLSVAGVTDYDLSADKTTVTIKRGESALITITVTPKNGFVGTVGFSCGTLPAGVRCAFAPASVTPNGRDAVKVSLAISTTLSASAAPAPRRSNSQPPLWASLWGMGAIGMVVVGGTNRKRAAMMLVGLLAIGLLVMLMGCGHVTDTQVVEKIVTVSQTTPLGTTTVQVQAGAFGSSKSLPLTITIN